MGGGVAMDIQFAGKLEQTFNEEKKLQRKYGHRAKLIQRRLGELRAADSLAVMKTLPSAACHRLTGDRKGQYAVNVGHPFRMVFIPKNDPLPQHQHGGLDETKVTTIEIQEIVDYHG